MAAVNRQPLQHLTWPGNNNCTRTAAASYAYYLIAVRATGPDVNQAGLKPVHTLNCYSTQTAMPAPDYPPLNGWYPRTPPRPLPKRQGRPRTKAVEGPFRLLLRATSGVQARATQFLVAQRVITPPASEPNRELAVLLWHLFLCAPSSVFREMTSPASPFLVNSALDCDERSPVR